MKLNKDSFLVNMKMDDLDGKNVLVQPSQAKSTKGQKPDGWPMVKE
jgi:hypothetical protein